MASIVAKGIANKREKPSWGELSQKRGGVVAVKRKGITHPDSMIAVVGRCFPHTHQSAKGPFHTTDINLSVLSVVYPDADLKVSISDDAKKIKGIESINFQYRLIPSNTVKISIAGDKSPLNFAPGSIVLFEGVHVRVSAKAGVLYCGISAQAAELAPGVSSPSELFYALEMPLYKNGIFKSEVDMNNSAAMVEFGDYGKTLFHLSRVPSLDKSSPPELKAEAEARFVKVPNGDNVIMSEDLTKEGMYKTMGGTDNDKRLFETTLDVLSWRSDSPAKEFDSCDDWSRYMLAFTLFDEELSATFRIFSVEYWKRLWYIVREARFDLLLDINYKKSKLLEFWKNQIPGFDGALQVGGKVILIDLPLFLADIGVPISFEEAKNILAKQEINLSNNPLHPRTKEGVTIPLVQEDVILAQELSGNLEMFKHIGSHFVAVPFANMPQDKKYLQNYRSLPLSLRKFLLDTEGVNSLFSAMDAVSFAKKSGVISDFFKARGETCTDALLELFVSSTRETMPEYAVFIISSVDGRIKSFLDKKRSSVIQQTYSKLSIDPVAAYTNRIRSFQRQAELFGVELTIPEYSTDSLRPEAAVVITHPEDSDMLKVGYLDYDKLRAKGNSIGNRPTKKTATNTKDTAAVAPVNTNNPENVYSSMNASAIAAAEKKLQEEEAALERELADELTMKAPAPVEKKKKKKTTAPNESKKREREEEGKGDQLDELDDDDFDLGFGEPDPNPRKTKRSKKK